MGKSLLNSMNLFKKHRVMVLAYHNVDEFGKKSFEEQMIYLKDNYNVVPLSKLVDLFKSGKARDAKYAAITFDDGYRDNYEIAFPIVERLKIPATLYLTAGYLDSDSDKYLKWDMAKKMIDSGLFSIGNHTYSHKILSTLSREEQKREIKSGRERIEDMLAVKPASFAYPFGQRIHYTHDTIDILKNDGYDFAVSAFPMEIKSPFNDFYEIPRISSYNVKSLKEFKIRLITFWSWFQNLKTVYVKRESLHSRNNIEGAMTPFIRETLNGKSISGNEINIRLEKMKICNWSYILFFNVNNKELKNEIVIKFFKPMEVKQFSFRFLWNDQLAERVKNEYLTLEKLHKLYSKSELSQKLEIVRPLGHLKSLNGIVMEEMRGKQLYYLIKTKQLSQEKIRSICRLVGQAIAYYHNNMAGIKKQSVIIDEIFTHYKGVDTFFDSKIDLICRDLGREAEMAFSGNLLGLEVRNIFYSAEDDKIILHDIIELTDKSIFNSIAEFLVSIDLIDYGCLRPQNVSKKDYYFSFLDGYFGAEGYSPGLLKAYVLREYIRFYQAQKERIFARKYLSLIQKSAISFIVLTMVKRRIKNNFLIDH